MPDSAPSAIFTATSPAPAAPMPPTIDSVTFDKLKAQLAINMPTKDVNGDALSNLVNIKVFSGSGGADLAGVVPVEFPGSYAPGSQQMVAVSVPAYATAYEFEAEVSI